MLILKTDLQGGDWKNVQNMPNQGKRLLLQRIELQKLRRRVMKPSQSIEPGSTAPDFELPNANASVGKKNMTLSDVMGENGTIVFFTCNHCPYVVGSEPRIERIAEISRSSGIGFAGINSNDPVKYESDSWENMVKRASRGMSYPYLHDEDQKVAVSYGAERTPEFYLVSASGTVVYRGRMDDSPRDPSHASTSDLSDAIDELLNGKEISTPRTDSIGCSVKWKI